MRVMSTDRSVADGDSGSRGAGPDKGVRGWFIAA